MRSHGDMRAISISVGSLDEYQRRAQNDPKVEPDGPVVDVPDIALDALDHFLDGIGFTAKTAYLGQAGKAGLHAVALHVAVKSVAEIVIVGNRMRPRPHDRHMSLQHVDELRQLVETAGTQEAAKPGDPRVVDHGLGHLDVALDVLVHGAEFPDVHLLAAYTVALLAIEDGAGRTQLH